MSKKREVEVKRRRRTDQPGGRERADAPRRRKQEQQRPSSQSSSRPPSSGGGSLPTLPLGGSGGGRSPWMIIIVVIVLLVLGGSQLFGGGGDSSGGNDGGFVQQPPPSFEEPAQPEVNVQEETAVESEPFVPPVPATGEGQTWLIMLYADADDKILEQDIYLDMNEAERVGSSDRVHIVAQVDRFQAGYRGDGDWASTRRYYITQNNDLDRLGSRQVTDLGEVNMSDGKTLVDFVAWAADAFPADKYVLIMSDHGMGWPGGWSDPSPGGRADPSIALSSALGDQLYLMELDDALGDIRAQTDIDQFELIGFDACLMGHLEVFSAVAPHARYAVASQEVEPALGWAYTGFLSDLVRNPDVDGAALGQYIVNSYIGEDQRIVDDAARAEFARQGSPVGGLFGLLLGGGGGATAAPSAAQVTQQLEQNITLTAVDLSAIPAVMSSFNDLAFAMQNSDQRAVSQARTYAQSFTSVFGSEVPPSYIDLGNFVQLLGRQDSSLSQSANQVLAAIDQAVIAERHGPKKPGATGLSIYFPNSQLYSSPVVGAASYTAVAARFANSSLWDDFLAFHYTGRTFESSAQALVVPDRSGGFEAPGAGEITVSPLSLSGNSVAPGETIELSVDISGENVGYVKLFVGFLDAASNSIFMADSDYLESPDTREVGGIFYPDWGQGEFTMNFAWEPVVFAISDGTNSEVALFTPQTYGATFEDSTYTVDGIYTYADGGESRYARLLFRDGIMQQAFGFTNENGTGAPREITPQSGDTFTVLERWLDLDGQGRVTETAAQQGGTLTFNDQPLVWEVLDAAAGDYLVGFIIEDLDGNAITATGQVTVR